MYKIIFRVKDKNRVYVQDREASHPIQAIIEYCKNIVIEYNVLDKKYESDVMDSLEGTYLESEGVTYMLNDLFEIYAIEKFN